MARGEWDRTKTKAQRDAEKAQKRVQQKPGRKSKASGNYGKTASVQAQSFRGGDEYDSIRFLDSHLMSLSQIRATISNDPSTNVSSNHNTRLVNIIDSEIYSVIATVRRNREAIFGQVESQPQRSDPNTSGVSGNLASNVQGSTVGFARDQNPNRAPLTKTFADEVGSNRSAQRSENSGSVTQ